MDDTAASGGSMMVAAVSSGRLGGRVRELRRGRGLTLEELAELSGVSRAMISKLERGEKNPTLVVAAKLAEGLGVTLSRLAGTDERRGGFFVPRDGLRAPAPFTELCRKGRGVHTQRDPRGLHLGRVSAAPQGCRGAHRRRAREFEGDTGW